MKWATGRNVHVDRTACAWLIQRFIDPDAEFIFLAPGDEPPTGARTFDMRGATYGHVGERCTFQTILERHQLTQDPALVEMGWIIRDADVPPARNRHPDSAGIAALNDGLALTEPHDEARIRVATPLYEALYQYCRARAEATARRSVNPNPRLRMSYRRRVDMHLADDGDRGRASRVILRNQGA
jgi:hypothetical protein